MKKPLNLLNSQFIRYIITGGITTGINYVIFILLTVYGLHYLTANSFAWVGAVIFAFYANRNMVFHSDGNVGKELIQFVSVRLLTLLAENILLFVMIEWMGFLQIFSKIGVSIITVTLNYIACKYSIFKERGVSHE